MFTGLGKLLSHFNPNLKIYPEFPRGFSFHLQPKFPRGFPPPTTTISGDSPRNLWDFTRWVHCFPLKKRAKKFGLPHVWAPIKTWSSGSTIKILLATFSAKNQLHVKHFPMQFEWLGAKYQHFCDQFLWRKLLDTFSIVKLTKHYSTILLQFVPPTFCGPFVTPGWASRKHTRPS